MSYMTKDQLENYLNGLPSTSKEKKTEYSQIKSELVYPMQNMSFQPQQEEEEEVSYGTIQDRMKRLRDATGTVVNATNTMTPAFPETPKPMVPTKPSFSANEPDAFEASLNPRLYAQRRQQRQQQQQQQQQQKQTYSPPIPPVQQKPPTPPLPPFISSPSTPPAIPSSPRPPKPNNRDSLVRTLNPIYAGLECPACQKPIDGSVVSAMDKIWHSHCFRCTSCQKTLENEQYFEKDGQAYCEKDYKSLFSLYCDFCHKPIENSAISALGKHYHEGHFGCTACQKPFGDHSAFMVHDDKPYCQEDYMKMCGKKCSGCSQYISGEYINALGQEWHKSCFNCFDCKKPFTGGTFLVRDDKPYCEEHYHHPRQQPSKRPEPKVQQQSRHQQQERTPPPIKPKPSIARKPDFSPKQEEQKRPEINTKFQTVRTPELNIKKRPEINNRSSTIGSRISPEVVVKRQDSNSSKKDVKVVAAGSTGSSKMCHQCHDTIDGPSASALGHDYHIHHFQCSRCSRALSSRVPGMWQGDANGNLVCKMCALKN